MTAVAILIAVGPMVMLVALTVVNLWKRRVRFGPAQPQRGAWPGPGLAHGGPGGGTLGGVREPRRPLVPHGSAGAEAPLDPPFEDDVTVVALERLAPLPPPPPPPPPSSDLRAS